MSEQATGGNDQTRLNRRKLVVGVVTSDKMNKTRTVVVERLQKHPKYGKFLRRRKVHHAHDEKNESRIGDTVEIAETRPLSKLKRWRLVRIVAKSKAPVETEE